MYILFNGQLHCFEDVEGVCTVGYFFLIVANRFGLSQEQTINNLVIAINNKENVPLMLNTTLRFDQFQKTLTKLITNIKNNYPDSDLNAFQRNSCPGDSSCRNSWFKGPVLGIESNSSNSSN